MDGTTLSNLDALCDAAGLCTFLAPNYPNGYNIAAGSTINVSLVADLAASLVAGDYLSVSIQESTAPSTVAAAAAPASVATQTVVWSDNANNGSTIVTDLDWFSDRGIEVLPTTSWTFSKQ